MIRRIWNAISRLCALLDAGEEHHETIWPGKHRREHHRKEE